MEDFNPADHHLDFADGLTEEQRDAILLNQIDTEARLFVSEEGDDITVNVADIDQWWAREPQLVVLNLEATHPTKTAKEAIEAILAQVKQLKPACPAFTISLGKQINQKTTAEMLDFAYLGNKSPSNLEVMRRTLVELGYDAILRPQDGNDRTRQLQVDLEHLGPLDEELKEKLEQHVLSKGAVIKGRYVDRADPPRFYAITVNDRHLVPEICSNTFLVNNFSVRFRPPQIEIPQHPYEMRMQVTHDDSLYDIKRHILGLFDSSPGGIEFQEPLMSLRIDEKGDGSVAVFIMRTAKAAQLVQTHWSYHRDINPDSERPMLTYKWNKRFLSKKYKLERNKERGQFAEFVAPNGLLDNRLREIATRLDVTQQNFDAMQARMDRRDQEAEQESQEARQERQEARQHRIDSNRLQDLIQVWYQTQARAIMPPSYTAGQPQASTGPGIVVETDDDTDDDMEEVKCHQSTTVNANRHRYNSDQGSQRLSKLKKSFVTATSTFKELLLPFITLCSNLILCFLSSSLLWYSALISGCACSAMPTMSNVSPTDPFLSILALNVRGGLERAEAVSSILKLIRSHLPQVIILTETKLARSAVRIKTALIDLHYTVHEVFARSNAISGKGASGGVLVAISEQLPVLNVCKFDQLPILSNRAIGVQVGLCQSSGKVVPIQIYGLYAPAIEGRYTAAPEFWSTLSTASNACATVKTIWSGDFNVSLDDETECFPEPSVSSASQAIYESRQAYETWLASQQATDIWSQKVVTIKDDWTFTSSRSDTRQFFKILDRTAVAGLSPSCASIRTLTTRTFSDHRAIVTTVTISGLAMGLEMKRSEKLRGRPRTKCPSNKSLRDQNRKISFINAMTSELSGWNEVSPDFMISSDADWDALYYKLRTKMEINATQIFTRPVYKPQKMRAETTELKHLLKRLRVCGRLVSAIARGQLQDLLDRHPAVRNEYSKMLKDTMITEVTDETLSPESCARRHMRGVRKLINKAQIQADRSLDERKVKGQISDILKSSKLLSAIGRTKPLQLPDVLQPGNQAQGHQELYTGKERIHTMVKQYFQQLLSSQDVSGHAKPWLTEARFIQQFVNSRRPPFQWPQVMNLDDLDGLLRSGKPKPSPGPDDMEKWWLRILPKDHMCRLAVKSLVNYSIIHNYFPSELKATTLLPFWKGKGSVLDLSKYRGIMFSNLIANLPVQWCTKLLQTYAQDQRLLPPLQIATKSGVQTRDLTSFLAQLEEWAHRSKTPIFAAKRDKEKGFDFQHKTGFWDCCKVFGLPDHLLEFDRFRLSHFACKIRTSFGDTEPIFLSGVNKQGDSMSPLKYVLLAGLAHHWVEYVERYNPSQKTSIQVESASKCIHRPPMISLRAMAVMDDDIQFALSKDDLSMRLRNLEVVESAYGARTNWDDVTKTVYTVYGQDDDAHPRPPIKVQTIAGEKSIPYREQLDLVRCTPNRPEVMLGVLLNIIKTFELPRAGGRLVPIRGIRRIVKTCLVPKIESRLRLQPVPFKAAPQLDSALVQLVVSYYGFPIKPRRELLLLPCMQGGEGFPGFEELNSRAAVGGLIRDLTHRDEAFKELSSISYNDWRCGPGTRTGPRHKNPLGADSVAVFREASSTAGHTSERPRLRGSQTLVRVPASWVIAKSYLVQFQVMIEENPTIERRCPHTEPPPNPARSTWGIHYRDTSVTSWTRVTEVARSIENSIGDDSFSELATDGSCSRLTGLTIAAGTVIGVLSPNANMHSADERQFRHIASARIVSDTAQSYHAEILGLILALSTVKAMAARNRMPTPKVTIHSDCLILLKKLDKVLLAGFPESLDLVAPRGRSWYRYLLVLYRQVHKLVDLRHVKAHEIDNMDENNNNQPSLAQKLNKYADEAAQRRSKNVEEAIDVPHRLVEMEDDHYFIAHNGDELDQDTNKLCRTGFLRTLSRGMTDNDILWALDDSATEKRRDLKIRNTQTTDYSYRTLLQIKGDVLPTNWRLSRLAFKGQLKANMHLSTCLHTTSGCFDVETLHHVFVECPGYEPLRQERAKHLKKTLHTKNFNEQSLTELDRLVEILYKDGPHWPQSRARWYFGLVPSLPESLGNNKALATVIIQSHVIVTTGYLWSRRERLRYQRTVLDWSWAETLIRERRRHLVQESLLSWVNPKTTSLPAQSHSWGSTIHHRIALSRSYFDTSGFQRLKAPECEAYAEEAVSRVLGHRMLVGIDLVRAPLPANLPYRFAQSKHSLKRSSTGIASRIPIKRQKVTFEQAMAAFPSMDQSILNSTNHQLSQARAHMV